MKKVVKLNINVVFNNEEVRVGEEYRNRSLEIEAAWY